MKIKNIIIICVARIQLFLWPYLLNIGIENLSTNGAHKNLNTYANVSQAKKPIYVRLTSESFNQAGLVVIKMIYGNPDENPRHNMTNIFFGNSNII
jgi:hypothetical protein